VYSSHGTDVDRFDHHFKPHRLETVSLESFTSSLINPQSRFSLSFDRLHHDGAVAMGNFMIVNSKRNIARNVVYTPMPLDHRSVNHDTTFSEGNLSSRNNQPTTDVMFLSI